MELGAALPVQASQTHERNLLRLKYAVESERSPLAVMLAAGLDRIENKIDPGPMNHENLYEVSESELKKRNIRFLPTTLREALDKFSQDTLLQEAIGLEYAQYYQRAKSEEWRAYHQSVSAWETENYLKLY
jgi:glutamine synthetase